VTLVTDDLLNAGDALLVTDPHVRWAPMGLHQKHQEDKMKTMKVIGLMMVICSMMSQAYAEPYWGSFKKEGCWAPDGQTGYRKYSSVLWGINGDWEEACAKQPADINGNHFYKPRSCRKEMFLFVAKNMWGEFAVPDTSCN
jgi:hypothetical protein